MKKTFLFAAIVAVLSLVGCNSEDEPVAKEAISLSQSELNLTYENTNVDLSIKATGEWAASLTADWVGLSAKSGNGNSYIAVIVDNNEGEARTATIDFVCEGETATLTINQDAYGEAINTFDVTITKTSPVSIYAKVTPNDYYGTWYVAVVPYSLFMTDKEDQGFGGDGNYMADIYMQKERDLYLTDLSIVDDMYVFQGKYSQIDLLYGWGGADDTEQAICIFGMNSAYEVTTEATMVFAATDPVDITDFTIDATFDNITQTSAEYAIYPSDDETYYIYSFYSNIDDYFAAGGTDALLYQDVFNRSVSEEGQVYSYKGDLTKDNYGNALVVDNLDASLNISFVGFGLEMLNGMVRCRCTDAQIHNFKTLAYTQGKDAVWTTVQEFKPINVKLPMTVEAHALEVLHSLRIK